MSTPTLDEIRGDDGKLPAYAWPGGYPILYLDAHNSVLCPKCANEQADDEPEEAWKDDFRPVAWFIHYEGEPEYCEECNAQTPSAYGVPE